MSSNKRLTRKDLIKVIAKLQDTVVDWKALSLPEAALTEECAEALNDIGWKCYEFCSGNGTLGEIPEGGKEL